MKLVQPIQPAAEIRALNAFFFLVSVFLYPASNFFFIGNINFVKAKKRHDTKGKFNKTRAKIQQDLYQTKLSRKQNEKKNYKNHTTKGLSSGMTNIYELHLKKRRQ